MADYQDFPSRGGMEDEVTRLEANQAIAQHQRRMAAEARARASSHVSGDYFDDLAEVRAAELGRKRGSYNRRQERQGLGAWLTPTQERLLRVLAHCIDTGRPCPAVIELANRVGCSERAIRYGLTRLVELEMVSRLQRPSRNPRRSMTNRYSLLPQGWLRLGRRGSVGTVTRQKIAEPSDSKIIPCTGNRSAPLGAPAVARSAPNGAARPPEPQSEGLPPSRSSEIRIETAGSGFADGDKRQSSRYSINQSAKTEVGAHSMIELARTVAARISGSEKRLKASPDPFALLDSLRRQQLSKFHGAAWLRAVAAHGREIALLAAAVAMIRREDSHGRPIQSAASYLGAMLRLPPGHLDPMASLRGLIN